MPINQDFISKIATRPPLDILATSLESSLSTCVRINKDKGCPAPSSQKVSWCDTGYELSTRPRFTFDPALHQGLYYVQDSSSMSITAAIAAAVAAIGLDRSVRYLDLCAAPGGKTTAAISALPQGSIVAANEYDYKRAEILAENVAKWGIPGVVVTRGDTKAYRNLPGYFNIVAVDAPCSGEGMMRKDAKAAEQWSMQLVRECAALQREILDNAWEALAPGGYLIYSTCTFNTIENEDNVRYMIENFDAAPIEIPVLEAAKAGGVKGGIDCDFPSYRFIPGHIRGEGQFMALLQKPYTASAEKRALKASAKGRKGAPYMSFSFDWLKGDWKFWQKGDEIFGALAPLADDMRMIADKTNALLPGLHIGTQKGRDIIPSQALALCINLNEDAFPTCELSLPEAISYLQRQAPNLEGAPKGIVLLTFGGHPLGFAKNLGNRANNLYPKEWRIISQADA